MERRWKTKDRVVTSVIESCKRLSDERRLSVTYRYQRGHQSIWAGVMTMHAGTLEQTRSPRRPHEPEPDRAIAEHDAECPVR
jgi:hypothetical protein